ncbi:hypothetical protein HPB52_021752 [Rhipicephalus sanguineus]|uniref:Uncharacterized protein n=1 Tax=Rhipicephalus sanguineus TaxID=34632 RepID=A0A9D4QH19_RHISA|nr:hypothetical protein HPB52_021752 [Rhipicephalus sanguineus]
MTVQGQVLSARLIIARKENFNIFEVLHDICRIPIVPLADHNTIAKMTMSGGHKNGIGAGRHSWHVPAHPGPGTVGVADGWPQARARSRSAARSLLHAIYHFYSGDTPQGIWIVYASNTRMGLVPAGTPGTSQLTLARVPLAWLTGGRKPGLVEGRRRKR